MRSQVTRNSKVKCIASFANARADAKPKAPEPQEPALAANSQSFGRVLTIVHSDCALLERDGNISLLALPVAERWLRQVQLTPGEAPVCAQPLLIPLRLKVSGEEKSALEKRSLPWRNWVLISSQMHSM